MEDSKEEKYAELIYNKILTEVAYPLLGNKTTYLSDLTKVGKKMLGSKYLGTFSSDQIQKLTPSQPYSILNLDTSKESGSHWIAVALDTKTNKTVAYDSFGRSNIKIIPALSKSDNGSIVDTDRDVEQDILETDCGARSIAFLLLFDSFGVDIAKMI